MKYLKFSATTVIFSMLAVFFGAVNVADAQETTALVKTAAVVCTAGTSTLNGTVLDTTLALVPGATVTLDGKATTVSGDDGGFKFPCVSNGAHTLSIAENGFANSQIKLTTPYVNPQGKTGNGLQVVLELATVETNVKVTAAEQRDPNSTGASQTIAGERLQSLADDPDDLLQELQQLGGAAGGSPSSTTITVDGFQGASAVPPKGSIAYIKVNPDMFSSEYGDPAIGGGRVEIYTKPGQKTYHGALFMTNGSSWENARDPFAISKATIGKQRYGMELSGPIRKQGSDFAMTFEHRIINDFAVVDAITFDQNANEQSTIANVPTPQSLWLATLRSDWQLGAKNTLILSYSANANSLNNQGVGGTTLAQAGYNSQTYEHMARVSFVTLFSAKLMHEARLSLRWDGTNAEVESTAPQVSVAGAFTGGGATVGPEKLHELNVEFDDDAIWTSKKHTLKFGTQFMMYHENQQQTTNFNGTYTFGGGVAPVLNSSNQPIAGQTEIITGVQQYQRALLGYAGGTPTAYSSVSGSPGINLTQGQNAAFIQDDWNVGHRVHFNYGLRWLTENDPAVTNGFTPRVAVLWSPDKKSKLTIHAHYGLFAYGMKASGLEGVKADDGITHITSTIYNPVYGNPTSGNPTIISSKLEFSQHMGFAEWTIENFGAAYQFPHGWNVSADYYQGRNLNQTRTENINSPLNDSPTGPRPGPANENILQIQNSGQGFGKVMFIGIDQHSYKRVQFFVGAVVLHLVSDADNNYNFEPQSVTTDAGEYAQRSGAPRMQTFGNGTLHLPKKIDLSTNIYSNIASNYNITTGYDNNGDGDFNDRPMYAAPGTTGAVQTPYGLLTDSGGIAVLPRNRGLLPPGVYMDANIQRAFLLTKDKKAAHQQTVTVNVRSSNVLNHLNVTSEGGVLGSPLFGVPYAAGNGRRIEFGARYSF